MSAMIVDANVTTYWSISSPFTSSAANIMKRPDLCAPRILLVETTNALLKYVRAGVFHYEQLQECMFVVESTIAEFVLDGDILHPAAEIAYAEKQSIYDCLYLALAVQRRRPLATADKRLAAIAQKYDIFVELIEPEA
jgi:predicted nucleic acid-binding protein